MRLKGYLRTWATLANFWKVVSSAASWAGAAWAWAGVGIEDEREDGVTAESHHHAFATNDESVTTNIHHQELLSGRLDIESGLHFRKYFRQASSLYTHRMQASRRRTWIQI